MGSALALLVAALSVLSVHQPASAQAGSGAVFTVGAAMRSVAPSGAAMKTHVGGYGDCNGCPTTAVRKGDEFAVRAFYVSDGITANVMVSAPAEGWFAGYQENSDAAHPGGLATAGDPTSKLGITDLRAEAAHDLTAAGGGKLPANSPIAGRNIIVSTIHCHACPTLVGIWGPTNLAYLHFVYEQALGAILDAQKAARPAHLQWATGDIGYVNDVTMGQSNANEGWPIDGQLSVLQARAVADNSVIGTYMNVPAHGNLAYGPDLREMNDEHFGAASQWLERHVGGVGVVAAGTLGDQTTPMQGDSTRLKTDPRGTPDGKTDKGALVGYPRVYDVIDRLGALTGSTAVEALAHHGHLITDPTLKAAEQLQPMQVTGAVAFALLYGNTVAAIPGIGPPLAGALPAQAADRSHQPPYTVATQAPTLGVWFTALRIGDIAIASEPGEAFPHVSFAIRNQAMSGAAATFTVANAQDQLGYYFEPYAFLPSVYYSADHYIFNIGVTLSTQNIQADYENATGLTPSGAQVPVSPTGGSLGFTGQPPLSQDTDALSNDYLRYFLKGGVQVMAFPPGAGELMPAGPGITIPIGIQFNHARGSEKQCAPQIGILCSPGVPTAEVNTGPAVVTIDGHAIAYTPTDNGGSYAMVTFPCPGDYTMTATLPGTKAHWKDVIHVYSASMVTNTTYYEEGSNTGPHPLALQNLGDLKASGLPGCGGYNPPSVTVATGGGGGMPNTSALVGWTSEPGGVLVTCLLLLGIVAAGLYAIFGRPRVID
ncbi:MAG: hypothetical protein ACR2MY_13540 [Candidatus Dormibacteria bacterium]